MQSKDMTYSAIMLAILIICSQIALPIGPVPITLQTLAVLMIGYILPPKTTLFVTILYAFGGLLGLPFFSGFSGGFQSVLLPSFGFVLSFILAAFIQSKYLATVDNLQPKHYIVAGFLNIMITYLIGLPYMAFILNSYMGNHMGMQAILLAGFIPFLPGDFLKLAVSVTMAKRIRPMLKYRMNF